MFQTPLNEIHYFPSIFLFNLYKDLLSEQDCFLAPLNGQFHLEGVKFDLEAFYFLQLLIIFHVGVLWQYRDF